MALKRTSSGKVDKRTKEYKEMCANLAKARKKAAKKHLHLLRLSVRLPERWTSGQKSTKKCVQILQRLAEKRRVCQTE